MDEEAGWFIVFVIAPSVLATLYYGLFVSDIYVSESRFVIKNPYQKRSQVSSFASLVHITGLSGRQGRANEALDFVRSRDAFNKLDKNPGFRSLYNSEKVNFLGRFPQPRHDDSLEGLYKFYWKQVDAEAGTSTIKIKGFTAENANAVSRLLLDLSDYLINRLNNRIPIRTMSEAQRQVGLAAKRAKAARLALAQYQNSPELIDPAEQAGGAHEISNGLIAQRAALQAQLDQMQRGTLGSPSIPALQNHVNALSVQIGAQDNRVVGSKDSIASKLGCYENLLVRQEFVTENLNTANVALVQSGADTQRQQYNLGRVVEPNFPEISLSPNRVLNIIIVALSAACLCLIGQILIVGILHHASGE